MGRLVASDRPVVDVGLFAGGAATPVRLVSSSPVYLLPAARRELAVLDVAGATAGVCVLTIRPVSAF